MAINSPPRDSAVLPDDFQRAAAAAKAEIGEQAWSEMMPQERTRTIYAQLRKLDAVRAEGMPDVAKRRHRFRVSGEATKLKS
jgi:hypothetical protein